MRDAWLKDKLEEAADNAAKKAVAEATKEADVRVMFLIDKSGSMKSAIEKSKEALAKILAGFPLDKLHVAASTRWARCSSRRRRRALAVQHMLAPHQGGRRHDARRGGARAAPRSA